MKANFYIHGVPKGQEIWGDEQDRDYIKSFYSATYNEHIRFVVEIIPAKRRTYYTYIKGRNVFGTENREGSFLGITISFDNVYCTDTESLFELFEQIFNQKVIGSILINQNVNLRFSTTFENKAKELDAIKSLFFQQLDAFNDDFEKLDSSFNNSPSNQVAFYNIADVDSSSFYATLKKTLKVYCSPEYPTRDSQINSLKKQVEPEKAKSKQLAEENEELKNQLTSANNSIKRYLSELTQLKSDKKQLDEQNTKLRSENASLKSELERNKAKNGIEKSVNQIKQPLEELLRHVRKISPTYSYHEESHHHSETNHSEVNEVRLLVHEIVLGIILILLIALTCISISQMDWSFPSFPKKEKNAPAPKPQPKAIVIFKSSSTELEVGKEYEAQLMNVPSGLPIKWRIDGADVVNGEKNQSTIKFKPLADKDSVYLTGCVVVNDKDSIIEKKVWQIIKKQ